MMVENGSHEDMRLGIPFDAVDQELDDLLAAGKYHQARIRLEDFLRKNPENPVARQTLSNIMTHEAKHVGTLGQEAYDRGNLTQAVVAWKDAIRTVPGNTALREWIARAERLEEITSGLLNQVQGMTASSPETVISTCESVLNMVPNHAEAMRLLTEARAQQTRAGQNGPASTAVTATDPIHKHVGENVGRAQIPTIHSKRENALKIALALGLVTVAGLVAYRVLQPSLEHRSLIRRAETAIGAGDWGNAASFLQKIAMRDPEEPRLQELLSQFPVASSPPVVALLFKSLEPSTRLPLVPIAIFDASKTGWTAQPLEVENSAQDDEFVLKNRPLAESLMKMQFYHPYEPSLDFTPEIPSDYWMLDDPKYAVKGVLSEEIPSTTGSQTFPILMINRPAFSIPPEDARTEIDLGKLLPLLQEEGLRAVQEAMKFSRARVDVRLYGPPGIVAASTLDIEGAEKAYWLHLLQRYPPQKTPRLDIVDPVGFPKWSLEHFVVVQISAGNAYRILWQKSFLNLDQVWRHQIRPIGSCDANADGAGEMVLMDEGWEFHRCTLYSITEGRLQEVASIGGAL